MVLCENAPTRHACEQMPFAHAQADARRRSRSKNVDRFGNGRRPTRRATAIGSARLVQASHDPACALGARASEWPNGVSPAHAAKAFRPGSRGGVHAHFWMMRIFTRFAVTCQAEKRASALSVQPRSQSSFTASAWTTGVQSATSGTAGNARWSPAATMPAPQRTDPAGRRGAVVSTPKKSCGVVEPTGRSNVAPKVGGIPVMPGVRALVCGGRKIARPRTQGAAMTRFLNELLLFSCLALFVTGVVLAAARLLI